MWETGATPQATPPRGARPSACTAGWRCARTRRYPGAVQNTTSLPRPTLWTLACVATLLLLPLLPARAAAQGGQGSAVDVSLDAKRTPRRTRAKRPHALLLTIDGFGDSTTDSGDVSVGGLQRTETKQDGGVGPSLSVSLGYLKQITDLMRFGGGLRYFGGYTYSPDGDGDDVDLGTMIEACGRLELVLPLAPDIDALVAGELGLGLLLAGGDLADDIDRLQTQGYNIWSFPRLGLLAGPELGGRYHLNPWLSLRGGVALLYAHFFLYDAETDDGGASASRGLALTRLRLSLGAEASF